MAGGERWEQVESAHQKVLSWLKYKESAISVAQFLSQSTLQCHSAGLQFLGLNQSEVCIKGGKTPLPCTRSWIQSTGPSEETAWPPCSLWLGRVAAGVRGTIAGCRILVRLIARAPVTFFFIFFFPPPQLHHTHHHPTTHPLLPPLAAAIRGQSKLSSRDRFYWNDSPLHARGRWDQRNSYLASASTLGPFCCLMSCGGVCGGGSGEVGNIYFFPHRYPSLPMIFTYLPPSPQLNTHILASWLFY